MKYPYLSYIQAESLLKAQKRGESIMQVSLDLGLTNAAVQIASEEIKLPDGQTLNLKQLKKIVKHDNRCYHVRDNEIVPIVVHSDKTDWVRTLYPTKSAPTTLVSGILMHRIKDTDPISDTKEKIKALGSLKRGIVLDTSTGLGYTAIEVAKYAESVITVEYDPAALEIAKLNPWSQKLFDNPKITQIVDDIEEVVKTFENGQFTHILHDPPTFKLAGELYSEVLYREFYRILSANGKLFHYIGDPNSEHGAGVTKGVINRLQSVGFRKIAADPNAFGVTAMK